MRRALSCTVGIVVPWLLAALAAGVAAADLEMPSPVVTQVGRATVYHGDLAGARERAVRAALVRALERYAGLRIEASTLISKGELIGREVRANTHGFVRSFEVLDERQERAEMVVTVRLTISEAPVKESFARLVASTSTLLLVEESNLGRPVAGQVLGAMLADPFFTAKVVHPPAETLRRAAARVPASLFSMPDPETVKELALRYLSGLVVVASARTRALDTGPAAIGYGVDPAVLRPVAAATGNLWVLDGLSGELIATRRFDDVRGSDASDPERAGIRALGKLAVEMQTAVVEALSEHVAAHGHGLRVVVQGPQAANGAPRVRQLLETVRWVDGVEIEDEEAGRVVLRLRCRERPVYVVEELRQAEEIEIVSFSAPAGELVVE